MNKIKIAQKFFDLQSSSWDENIEECSESRIQSIFRNQIPSLKIPILDLGSGTGILLPILESLGIRNKNIFEMDISSKMLQFARVKFSDQSYTNYIMADGHALPIINNQFGSVICFQVFPHFHDKHKVAKEIFSALDENGMLIILHLMGHKELNEMHLKAGRAVAKDRILPAQKLAQLLKSVGFTIEYVEESATIYLILAKKKQLQNLLF